MLNFIRCQRIKTFASNLLLKNSEYLILQVLGYSECLILHISVCLECLILQALGCSECLILHILLKSYTGCILMSLCLMHKYITYKGASWTYDTPSTFCILVLLV